MGKRHEGLVAPKLFYCFVRLGQKPTDQPVCYIVPSKVVAKVLAVSHDIWLRTPGRRGQPHKDNPTRQFKPDYSSLNPVDDEGKAFVAKHSDGWLDHPYREKWSVLGLPEAPEI